MITYSANSGLGGWLNVIKMRIGKLVIVFLLIHAMCITHSLATHIRAGEVIARRTSNLTFTYEFTFIGYRDTDSGIQFGGGDFDFGDGTMISEGFDVLETQLSNNIVRAEFKLVHTYQAPNSYFVSYKEDNRNANIANMANSTETAFYTETLIIVDPFFGVNNTPILTVPPIDEGMPGVRFVHNAGAFDVDGDSLAYYLVIPRSSKNSEVSGYRELNDPVFYSNFGQGSEQGGSASLDLDEAYGDLIWDAPGNIFNLAGGQCPEGISECAEYNVAFRIEEWRQIAGTWYRLGYVTRDMQVIIYEGDNEKPELEIPDAVCVTAGEQIKQTIIATDPDGHKVKMEAFGGPFEINQPASFDPSPAVLQQNPGSLDFEWNTFCGHVRERAYEVQFKVTDEPIENGIRMGPSLTEFGTWEVTVVGPAPKGLKAIVNSGRSIELAWESYFCTNASEIEVWRRVGDFEMVMDDCAVGMPPNAGYTLIAKAPASQISFVDTGLAPGANYCYRLVAQFPNPGYGTSYVSDEVCLTLEADAPIITNVDVQETSADGRIKVAWTPPYETNPIQFPPPYSYSVYRSDGFYLINPTLIADKLSDTVFFDQTGINTVENTYSYRIALYDGTGLFVDSSAIASMVALNINPLLSAIELSWQANVPWSNNMLEHPYHYVYRNRVSSADPDAFVLIDSVAVANSGFNYLDDGSFNNIALDDELIYCYVVTTYGGYDNPILPDPLINNSQVICAQPNDNIAPCAPIGLSITNPFNCATATGISGCLEVYYENMISWEENTGTQCDDDVIFFRVYFSASGSEEAFVFLDSTKQTTYLHKQLNSYKGCYRITAVDRSMNESEYSDVVCIDHCPQFILPNAFSPNGDDINDRFTPLFVKEGSIGDFDDSSCPRFILGVNFMVYDPAGQEVFSFTSEQENSIFINWDGKNKGGVDLPAGVYYYVAEVNFDVLDPSNRFKIIKGWVQLLK